MAWWFRRESVQQDTDGDLRTSKRQMMGAPGIAIFALTITFAAFDWIMSIDAHWFSTMFGVYYFGSERCVLRCSGSHPTLLGKKWCDGWRCTS